MSLIRVFIFIFLFNALIACSAEHNSSERPIDEGLNQTILAKLEKPSEIFFQDVFELVLQENCSSCHNSENKKAGVNLSNFNALLGKGGKKVLSPFNPEQSSVYETLTLISGSRKMPPTSEDSLTENQINLVYQWINNGAKNKGGAVTERPKSLAEQLKPFFNKPEVIDYEIVNEKVFKSSCLDCHSDSGSKADQDGAILYGQDMTSYEVLFEGSGIVIDKLTDYVVQEDGRLKKKKGSRIYKSMAINQSMPPTHDGYLPVNSLLVKLVRLWIKNCAIKNYDQIKDNDSLIEDRDKYSEKVRNCN